MVILYRSKHVLKFVKVLFTWNITLYLNYSLRKMVSLLKLLNS